MKMIKLTQGRFALVDDKNFSRLNKFKWYLVQIGRVNYAARKTVRRNGQRRVRMMHMDILKNSSDKIRDHINGDGLDNREINLRFATNCQNSQNKALSINSRSGYKGVSRKRDHAQWVARITINKKQKHLMYTKIKEVAALIYDIAAILHFGEFARTNFKRL